MGRVRAHRKADRYHHAHYKRPSTGSVLDNDFLLPDFLWYLGRRIGGLKLLELAEAVELRNDAVVATNVIRYEKRVKKSRAEQATVRKVLELLNRKI